MMSKMARKSSRATIFGKDMIVKGKTVYFTSWQVRLGHTYYFLMVIFMIASVAGLVWSIFDALYPSGLYAAFLSGNIGLKIIIIGIAAFLSFFLLILFYALRRKGTDVITKSIFASKRLYADLKVSPLARFTTWGLVASILIFDAGVVMFVIQVIGDYASGTQTIATDASLFIRVFDNFSGGEIFLVISFLALSTLFLIIFVDWLINAGTIFFAKIFLKIPLDVEKDSTRASANDTARDEDASSTVD